MLKTIDLIKNFGSLRAVENVSLEIEEKEIRAIIGPNGAGKSTLLDLITNRSRPTSGRVYFNGREITNLPPYKISSIGIGKCFQISKLFPELTAFENVQIACISKCGRTYNMYSAGSRAVDKEVNTILDLTGLGPMSD